MSTTAATTPAARSSATFLTAASRSGVVSTRTVNGGAFETDSAFAICRAI